MPNMGPAELIVLLVIALIVLGPKRLPSVGRSVGSGIREFKDGISGAGEKRSAEQNEATPLDARGERGGLPPAPARPATGAQPSRVAANAERSMSNG